MTDAPRVPPGPGPGTTDDVQRLRQYRTLLLVRTILGAIVWWPILPFVGPAVAVCGAASLACGPALASLRCRSAAARLLVDRTAASSDVSTAGFLVFSVACVYGLLGAACIAYGLYTSNRTTATLGAALLLCVPVDYALMRRSFRVVANEA